MSAKPVYGAKTSGLVLVIYASDLRGRGAALRDAGLTLMVLNPLAGASYFRAGCALVKANGPGATADMVPAVAPR